MASQTSALPDGSTLTKPAYTDSADIAVINTNMDKIVSNINAENQAISNIRQNEIVIPITANTDLNTLTTPGYYNLYGASNLVNAPASGANRLGLIVQRAESTQYVYQVALDNVNDATGVYVRSCKGRTWTAWQQLALKSDALLTPTLILEQIPTTSGENAYTCNWAIYKVLIIAIGNYGNIYTTITIPTSEFGVTANGHAIFISYGGGSTWSLYQNGQSGVKIIAPSSIQANTRIRIWGM